MFHVGHQISGPKVRTEEATSAQLICLRITNLNSTFLIQEENSETLDPTWNSL